MSKVKVGELCDILNGFAFKSANYVDNGIRIIRIANVQKGYIVDDAPEYYPLSAENIISNYMLYDGDLLMSLTGNVGRVGILAPELLPAALNQRVACIRIKNEKILDKQYLFYLFYDNYFENQCILSSKGIAQKNMSTEWLKEYKIPLPDISAQRQIATTLDKASELIALRKKQLEELDALAESVFYDMFGDPVKNEKGWKTETISALVKKKPNSLKRGPFGGALKKEIFVSDGCLVYEQYHALNNDYSFARYFITEDKFEELKSFSVESDDIIISCSGVNLGRLSVIPKNAKKGIINQALLKLSLNQDKMINSVFVRIFENESFKNKYFGNQRGCAIPNFPPMSDFKKFEFPTPPIALQTRFAAIIEKIEEQKELARKTLQESEDLFQRLMQDLFKPD